MKLLIALLFACIATQSATAADVSRIREMFQREFYSSYEEGKCGLNIDGFIKKADARGIDLSCVKLVHVSDYGGTLHAYHARDPRGIPQSRAWFHHYIALIPTTNHCRFGDYSLRPTDLVLDFDYGNSPRLDSLKKYLEAMLVPARIHGNKVAVSKHLDMGLAKFQILDAERYLKAIAETNPTRARELKKSAVVIPSLSLREAYLPLIK